MNIFSKRTLSVTESEVKKEYNKFSDEELNREVIIKFKQTTRLHSNVRFLYISLFMEVPLTRKQSLMYLEKFNTTNQMTAYFYRHLVRCAHFYGVPKVIINNYLNEKEMYSMYKDGTFTRSNAKAEHKLLLRKNADTLLSATLEMIHRSKSRKAKLEKLTDKIANKEI